MWRLPLCRPDLATQRGQKEQRAFTDDEMRRLIAAAPEPFATILVLTIVLGLRIGETLGLRVCDIDFEHRIVRVRQSVDSATRKVGGVKSRASSADMPMSRELEVRLRAHLARHDGKSDLLFTNKSGRPFCADKLRKNCSIRCWTNSRFHAADSTGCVTVQHPRY